MAREILLLGKDGQVGWELQRALAPLGRLTALGRTECDLADVDKLRATVRAVHPSIIVNAAAYTAVDKAESEADRAFAVNGTAPGVLAEEAKTLGARLVHYSTDYVFDGNKPAPYLEGDATAPLSVYGASKLQGEQAIQAVGGEHVIFRTSWVFAARGGNFAKTMLRFAREREVLKVVDDQFGAPTSAELIADISALSLHPRIAPQGLYHLAAAGETSWHGYAQFVLQYAAQRGVELKCGADQLQAIPTSGYPLPAVRPANSRLNTDKLQHELDVYLPDWTYHVERMLAETLGHL